MRLRNIGRLRAGGSGAPFLFDASNMPASAYGSRQLTASYTGPLFRVVRASDSTTLDVQQSGGLPNLSALTTFLSGTTGAVDLIYDQTGNGNHATQTTAGSRPVCNLEVAINGGFAPVFQTQFMNLPAGAINATTQSAHAFGVFENALTFPNNSAYFQMGNTATIASQGTLSQEATASLGWIRSNPGSVTQTVFPDSRPCVYEYQMGTDAQGGLRFYQNDETLSASQTASVAFTGGRIGDTQISTLHQGQFFFGCALFYNSVQTSSAAAVMRQKMANMFGITVTPSRKRIIIDGDSIGGGYTTALNWYGIVQRMRRNLPDCRIYNTSQSGFQLQNSVTDYASKLAPLLSAFGGSNCVFVEQRSINDFAVGGRTAAQVISDVQTIGNQVTATGATFVVTTTTPSSLSAGPLAERASYVSWLQANAAGLGWKIIDITTDPTVGTYSSTYYPDGTHPNAACCAIIAPYWSNVLATLI